MTPTGIQLPKLRFSRTLLQVFFWLLLFLFLASSLTSVRGLFDRMYRRAELRYKIDSSTSSVQTTTERWSEDLISVSNGGNGDAKNVLITILAPGGRLTRSRILSTEAHVPVQSNHAVDSYAINMNRLAPGAEVSLLIWI
ncbi:MAG TPA: hypothetical protein VL334_24205, partial [Anaerolineae bacterium]|nr:hypothetical protein [Anaerolineae bacterium]